MENWDTYKKQQEFVSTYITRYSSSRWTSYAETSVMDIIMDDYDDLVNKKDISEYDVLELKIDILKYLSVYITKYVFDNSLIDYAITEKRRKETPDLYDIHDYAIIEEKKPMLFNDMLIAMNTYHYMPDKPIYKYLSSNVIRAVLFNMVMYNELCFDVNILKCIRLMQEKSIKIKNNDDFLTSSDNI